MGDFDTFIKLISLPDHLKQEAKDFIEYLKSKVRTGKQPKPKRQAGLAKGLVKMNSNFDDPLPDFKEYM